MRLQLWDIAGQERYSSLSRAYYKDAFGCLVVGDLELDTIVSDVKAWKKDIDEKVDFPDTEEPLPCVMMANKVDKPVARDKFTDELK